MANYYVADRAELISKIAQANDAFRDRVGFAISLVAQLDVEGMGVTTGIKKAQQDIINVASQQKKMEDILENILRETQSFFNRMDEEDQTKIFE